METTFCPRLEVRLVGDGCMSERVLGEDFAERILQLDKMPGRLEKLPKSCLDNEELLPLITSLTHNS